MTNSAETPFPPVLDTPAFRAAWVEWIAYRKERRAATYKPRGLKAALSSLAAFGPDAAVKAIHTSIAQNYQGLFPVKETTPATKPKKKAGWL